MPIVSSITLYSAEIFSPVRAVTLERAVTRTYRRHLIYMGDRQPILPGRGTSDDARYLRTDELLALQKPPSEMTSRDELTRIADEEGSRD
ncbi:MAG: hypothetical protein QGG24_03840 [Vicinamibacterales bacterium]|nr:hypothetical protein [Vicinamibacterales bacterium]MDP7471148.1 hypothetical protein [Vicinamibacterales bacterium]MDP7672496.1 hypothetical protein [Vicinamibacterales bacterium]HJO37067.1 hypothetical protein [Vicinamibacterales bacterium]